MAIPRFQRIVELNGEHISLYIIIILELCTPIVAICTGANLYFHITTSCKGFGFLGITLIFIGVTLLILFLFTCCLAHYKHKVVVTKSLCGSVPLVVGLLGLGILALAVSSEGGGKPVPGRSYKVYEVESYSKWMQNKVNDNWDNYYKKVIIENKGKVCNNNKVASLLGADQTFQHGCCQPPEECNLNYTNLEVKAIMQENGNKFNNNIGNCKRWDNDPNKLCFDCESCKANFLQDVTSHWFTTGIGLVLAASIPLLMGFVYYVILIMITNGGSSHHYQSLV